MPNYVNTNIIFKGKSENIKEVIDTITTIPVDSISTEHYSREVDFNTLIPMPSSLDVEAGSRMGENVAVFLTNKGKKTYEELTDKEKEVANALLSNMFNPNYCEETFNKLAEENEDFFTNEKYSDGAKYVFNYINYGCPTWYEWRNKNWGTKWNACDSYVTEDTISFSTAWCVALPVIEMLNKLCMAHKVTFEGEFCDEDYYSTNKGKFFTDGLSDEVTWIIGNDLSLEEQIEVIEGAWGELTEEELENFKSESA
jgi:hypothetical protein